MVVWRTTVNAVSDTVEYLDYRCQRCEQWYRRLRVRMMCAVAHAPGQCCHYGETPKYPPPPRRRPNCALSNRWLEGGGGVCYGPGAIHAPQCPQPPRKGAHWERWT